MALDLVLFRPDIPQNAGTLLRLCACLGLGAMLVEPAGFPASDRHVRRAGLDDLDRLRLVRSTGFAAFEAARRSGDGRRLVLMSSRGETDYRDFVFAPGDLPMVGRESAGVPDAAHAAAGARPAIPRGPASGRATSRSPPRWWWARRCVDGARPRTRVNSARAQTRRRRRHRGSTTKVCLTGQDPWPNRQASDRGGAAALASRGSSSVG